MRRFVLVALLSLVIWGGARQAIKIVRAGPFPKPVGKDLYATDYRGSPAPELVVQQWLTKVPYTKDKVILVDFWATWCGPCRASIPELNALQERFKDDLVVIGLGDESPDTILAFRKQVRMDYAVGTDPFGITKRKMGIEGIPNVMIISTDGVVRWQGIPTNPEEPLTLDVVKSIIDVDPGVARRHAEEKVASAH